MSHDSKIRVFNPHDSARAEDLAGARLAGFGRRSSAFLIDMIVVFTTYQAAMLGLKYLLEERFHLKEDVYRTAHVQVRFDFEMTMHTAWILWLVLYFGLFVWRTNGLTPGKRLLGIRVASLTHERLTLWQSIERALGYGASALEGGFGFVQFFTNHNRCCVHDRIAETIVIRGVRGQGSRDRDTMAAPKLEEQPRI